MATLPIPPAGTPYIDPTTQTVSLLWQNYFLALQNAQGGFAPITSRFWVSTADTDLTNETNIGALATGYLKIVTAAGIATPSTTTTIPASDITGTLPIAKGGTNSATALSGSSIMISDGSKIIQGAAGTTSTLLHGNAAGAPTYGAVALASEVSGDLPFANLTQGSALSVLGVTGNATADNASIAAGSDKQVLRRSGTAVAFGAVDLTSSAAVTGALTVPNGGTGDATLTSHGVLIGAGTSAVAATSAGTSGHVLTSNGASADPTFQASGGAVAGMVIQVVSASYSTQTATTSSTFGDTGLTATITPASSSNKILAMVTQGGCWNGSSVTTAISLQLVRGSTGLGNFENSAGAPVASNTTGSIGSCCFNYLDSPATTSATTYKTQFATTDNASTVRVQNNSAVSSIILMEVKG